MSKNSYVDHFSEGKKTINLTIESGLLDLIDEQVKESNITAIEEEDLVSRDWWINEVVESRLTEIKRNQEKRRLLEVELRNWDERPISDLRITISPKTKRWAATDSTFGTVYCDESYSQVTDEHGMAWFLLPPSGRIRSDYVVQFGEDKKNCFAFIMPETNAVLGKLDLVKGDWIDAEFVVVDRD